MKACKHLDYDQDRYPSCELQTLGPPYEHVKFWKRDEFYPGCPTRVQFCAKGRGRINSILDCYEAPGPMGCYEPEE